MAARMMEEEIKAHPTNIDVVETKRGEARPGTRGDVEHEHKCREARLNGATTNQEDEIIIAITVDINRGQSVPCKCWWGVGIAGVGTNERPLGGSRAERPQLARNVIETELRCERVAFEVENTTVYIEHAVGIAGCSLVASRLDGYEA